MWAGPTLLINDKILYKLQCGHHLDGRSFPGVKYTTHLRGYDQNVGKH